MTATCELQALMSRTSNCFVKPELHVLAIRDRASLLAHHAHSHELRSRAYYLCGLAHETAGSPDDVIIVIIYKQQFLHSDWLRTCQLIPNQCKKV